MLKEKSLTDFTNLISPNNYKKNDDIVSNYFKNGWMLWLKQWLETISLLRLDKKN